MLVYHRVHLFVNWWRYQTRQGQSMSSLLFDHPVKMSFPINTMNKWSKKCPNYPNWGFPINQHLICLSSKSLTLLKGSYKKMKHSPYRFPSHSSDGGSWWKHTFPTEQAQVYKLNLDWADHPKYMTNLRYPYCFLSWPIDIPMKWTSNLTRIAPNWSQTGAVSPEIKIWKEHKK